MKELFDELFNLLLTNCGIMFVVAIFCTWAFTNIYVDREKKRVMYLECTIEQIIYEDESEHEARKYCSDLYYESIDTGE